MSIFIIAEIGINHNGDMKMCKQLIDLASIAGCDAVKFQKRDIETVYSKELLDSPRESPWGKNQRDQKMGLEFDKEKYQEMEVLNLWYHRKLHKFQRPRLLLLV